MAYGSKINTTDEGIIPIGSSLYGSCTSSGNALTKTVTMPSFDVLTAGVTIHVWFEYKNTASQPKLKVGSTVATPIFYNGQLGGNWEDRSLISFTYANGTWVQNDVQDGNGETYSLAISGNTLTLNGDGGTTSSVTIPDDDTKYGISISGHTISLVEGGSGTQVTVPDNNTTYTLSISGHTITLTPSSGTAQSVTVPDNNTTYTISGSGDSITLTGSDGSTSSASISGSDTTYALSKSGNSITLTGSDGSTSSVTDANTTYSMSISGNVITLTPSSGSAQTVTVPNDNTTYSMTINGHTITLTPSNGSPQTVTVPDNNTTYSMSISGNVITLTPSSGTAQTVTIPNDNTTYSMSISGHTITLTPSSGTAQTVTVPDDNTTYSLSISGQDLTLNASDGNDSTITIPSSSITAGTGLTIISPNTMRLAYSVGDVIITSTNTNPDTLYGGSWTLIDKRFAPANGTTGATWNTTNTQSQAFTWVRNDHRIWIRCSFQNKVAFTDNDQIICTINGASLGIASAPYARFPMGQSDGLNAGLIVSVTWSGTTATVTKTDVTSSAGTRSTATGASCYIEFDIIMNLNTMADSACNQFFWQRTA